MSEPCLSVFPRQKPYPTLLKSRSFPCIILRGILRQIIFLMRIVNRPLSALWQAAGTVICFSWRITGKSKSTGEQEMTLREKPLTRWLVQWGSDTPVGRSWKRWQRRGIPKPFIFRRRKWRTPLMTSAFPVSNPRY